MTLDGQQEEGEDVTASVEPLAVEVTHRRENGILVGPGCWGVCLVFKEKA